MIAAFGGNDVRVCNYARYGTKELSVNVLKAIEGRNACLMANHGMLATGSSLEKAMWSAVELETIAKQYYHSLLIGGPVILTDEEIEDIARGFGTYGHQSYTEGKRLTRLDVFVSAPLSLCKEQGERNAGHPKPPTPEELHHHVTTMGGRDPHEAHRGDAARTAVRPDVRGRLRARGLPARPCAGGGPLRRGPARLRLCELRHLLGLDQFLLVRLGL